MQRCHKKKTNSFLIDTSDKVKFVPFREKIDLNNIWIFERSISTICALIVKLNVVTLPTYFPLNSEEFSFS